MQTELSTCLKAQMEPPFLIVTDVDDEQSFFRLKEGVSLLVGSGDSCAVRLPEQHANNLHCMFRMISGKIHVQDWNTQGKTLVNGDATDENRQLAADDTVQIGPYRIALCLSEPNNPEPIIIEDECTEPETKTSPGSNAESKPIGQDLQKENFTNAVVEAAPEPRIQPKQSLPVSISKQPESDISPAEAELEILRNEVEYLQLELAEKDAQIAQSRSNMELTDQSVDETETERLVSRLEELLAELEGADDRVSQLENLLQVAEEANQAELEERHQLELWVKQIEQRILARESETAAEFEQLQNRLENERLSRAELESQLQTSLQKNGVSADGETTLKMLESLRIQNADLEARLADSQRQLKELPEIQEAQKDPGNTRETEQRVLELESNLVTERAERAREREQFTRFQQEMERKLGEVKRMTENESRVDAMKQHLRELHIEEQIERKERFERSLSGRIVMLWQKLDGR